MISFCYVDPDGESHPDPSPEELRRIILLESEEYWGNSGSAYLGWVDLRTNSISDCRDRPCLHFFLAGSEGFHFAYDQTGAGRLVTYDWSPLKARVRHYLGGEAAYYPTACLVSRERAWEVVRDFMNDAQRPSRAVSWISRSELDFDESERPV